MNPVLLIGGVPFGCDNIGDEAILASALGIFRRLFPDARFRVCTRDRAGTERKFGVETAPLYGFDPAYPARNFSAACAGADLFIWAGATGLSDYPAMACRLLAEARRAGLRTAVWGVGMNDVFNPAFFRLRGRKKTLCDWVRKGLGFDLAARWEARLVRGIRKTIAGELEKAEAVVLRDARSLAELRRCAPFPDAVAGADSAILQTGTPDRDLVWANPADAAVFECAEKRLALCVSEQNPIAEKAEFCAWLDALHERHPELLTVMIPMNPVKDFALMRSLQSLLAHPEQTLLTHFMEPEDVQTLVAQCSLVVSSRLHLIILGLNALVPAVGIARGSKIAGFLEPFGLPVAGTTGKIDFPVLERSVEDLLADPERFRVRAAPIRTEMLASLAAAETFFQRKLLF